jgi:hypothetical protein
MVEPQRSNSNTLLAFLASTHFITTTVIFPISIVALVPTMGLILLLGKMRKS